MRKGFCVSAVTAGCSWPSAVLRLQHPASYARPKGFNAHFPDMDAGGDGK